MEDVRTILCDLPTNIKGYVIRKDDYITIVLNSRLTTEENIKTMIHEMLHIQNGDFDKNCNVNFLELMAHAE